MEYRLHDTKTYTRIVRIISARKRDTSRQLRTPTLRHSNLSAARIELGAHPRPRHMKPEDFVPQQVFARGQLGWDGDRPLGASFAEEVGGPLGVAGLVVPELLDLDPDVTDVAFEGLAVIVGAVCKVARRVG